MTNATASSFSALTPNSSVTPLPASKVILHLAKTLPPPPATCPERFRVWNELDCGDSVPPSGSIPKTSIRDLMASLSDSEDESAKVSVWEAEEDSLSHSEVNVT